MKTASKVFIIIDLVCSIVLFFLAICCPDILGEIGFPSFKNINILYICYGIYSFIVSIASLFAVNGDSKSVCVVCGIFNIPVSLLTAIFMFCIPEQDLF